MICDMRMGPTFKDIKVGSPGLKWDVGKNGLLGLMLGEKPWR